MIGFVKKDTLLKDFIREFKSRNYLEAIKIGNKLMKKMIPDKQKVFILSRVGISYEELGDAINAVKTFQELLDNYKDSKGLYCYKAQALREMSYISYYQGDYTASINYMEKSNRYFAKMKEQEANISRNNLNIAMYLIDCGRIMDAKKMLEELSLKLLRGPIQTYIRVINLLGIIKLFESDFNGAEQVFINALNHLDSLYSDDLDSKNSNLKVMILFNLAWMYKESAKIEEAIKIFNRLKKIKCVNDNYSISIKLLEVELLVENNKIEEAEKILLELPNQLKSKQEFKFLVEIFSFIADLRIRIRDFDRAEDMLNACLELIDKVGPLEQSIIHVEFGKLEFEKGEYFESLKYIFKALSIIRQFGFSFTPLKVRRTLIKAINALAKTIKNILKEIQEKDKYTLEHSVRVAFYALKVSEMLNLSTNRKFEIVIGGLLHDIGKIKIPTDILTKPGKLTDEEFEVIKKHPVYGYELAEKFGLSDTIKNIILFHHQKYNGRNGYPENISGNQIPVEAQIVALCDIFDAMTSTRPYREALSFQTVLKYLEENAQDISNLVISNAFIRFLKENQELINKSIEHFEKLWDLLLNEMFTSANIKTLTPIGPVKLLSSLSSTAIIEPFSLPF